MLRCGGEVLKERYISCEVVRRTEVKQFYRTRRSVLVIERPQHPENTSSIGGQPGVALDALAQEKCFEAVCVGAPITHRQGRVRYPVKVEAAASVHGRGWKRQSYLVMERLQRV